MTFVAIVLHFVAITCLLQCNHVLRLMGHGLMGVVMDSIVLWQQGIRPHLNPLQKKENSLLPHLNSLKNVITILMFS